MSYDFDARLRREAQAWLTVRTHAGQVPLTTDELMDFAVDGRPFKLMDRQRGIRKPRELDAALSIRTVYAADLLNEVAGPMLEHGLKGRHGQPLMALPAVRAERPDRELLERRYTRFRTAG